MNTLLAAGLNENLAEIVGKLQTLMDSFWIYIVMALAGVVVVWGAFVGIKIAIAHKNEEKINAREMCIRDRRKGSTKSSMPIRLGSSGRIRQKDKGGARKDIIRRCPKQRYRRCLCPVSARKIAYCFYG